MITTNEQIIESIQNIEDNISGAVTNIEKNISGTVINVENNLANLMQNVEDNLSLIINGNSVNNHDIDSFINDWFSATESGNPEKPFNFFANDAVLFATVSVKFRNTPEEILDYFKMFIALPNLKNSLVKKLITKIDNNTWGYYAFVNWSWDGQPVTTARMSFVIRVHNNNKLKISLLHSSVLPDTP